jgi:hypothetical protein
LANNVRLRKYQKKADSWQVWQNFSVKCVRKRKK